MLIDVLGGPISSKEKRIAEKMAIKRMDGLSAMNLVGPR